MASFATRGKLLLSKLRPNSPDKLNNTRLGRIAQYFLNIAVDYKAAVSEMIADMRSHPGKTAVYVSVLTAAATLARTNPSETSFHVAVTESAHELLLLGESIRNHHSDDHVQSLLQASLNGTLRYSNCGLFSLMWIADCSPVVNTYKSQCKLVKPRWSQFHQHIVDIGILGRWHKLYQAMHDYDVNMEEWDATGKKRTLAGKDGDAR
ncbi:hypothetical protein C0Q70_15898 [Pomacea canaliculata]|uniref:Uncharacterized protein n=1 Tax=Pomacea canaliculata TaxID=400727 RepID=A0A2T7NNA9_POMCA|nr:mitochondrial import inner membrane translocase subunit Tim29-like isoform X2 [Pomacea canaliculata]PVD22643.1 hypothetical protein C0Q70_15898 [Pomacea canaliculata]